MPVQCARINREEAGMGGYCSCALRGLCHELGVWDEASVQPSCLERRANPGLTCVVVDAGTVRR